MITSVLGFLAALRQSQLLAPEQFDELPDVVAAFPEPADLAKELLRRGWLTLYQIAHLFQGRASDLLLGRYVLLEPLGQGGMGQVFKARHRRLDRTVALKLIRPDQLTDPEVVRRFQRESRAAGRLAHPNVITIHDADEINGTHFFAMEYVEGTDLGRLVARRGPLPAEEACDYVRQAALGLQHAHERGLVHRDVKPANLLVTGSPPVVKVLDLGLARLQRLTEEERLASFLTTDGALLGTLDYQAPEQALDPRSVDTRADVYSLGCTLYHLLAGRPPFADCSPPQKLVGHKREEPPALEAARPDLPPGLVAVVRRLLAKQPAERYQTPAEVAAALAPFAAEAAALSWTAAGQRLGELVSAAAAAVPRAVRSLARLRPHGRVSANPPAAPAEVQGTKDDGAEPASLESLVVGLGPSPAAAVVLRNALGMKLALIPAGTFTMGSPPSELGRYEDEGPQHEVVLTRPFYLGIYPVTQAEYERVLGRNPSTFRAGPGGGPEHPVENVPWSHAVEFCRRLSELPEERAAGRTYRLPTEAEWEYACRAGSTTPFHCGETLSIRQANCDGTAPYGGVTRGPCLGRTTPVGSYEPSAWGLYDLHGNVWEWCRDWYSPDYYALAGPREDPTGPAEPGGDRRRVLRGGSWCSGAAVCRSAVRYPCAPRGRYSYVGFRVVAVVRGPAGVEGTTGKG
jgi:formylglycine-generating enzyme required for sulfatase activity/tRNA A-37 threonylcarbamoyl transferase component Bud32